MDGILPEKTREEVDDSDQIDAPKETRAPTRSALTRWLAQRQMKQQAAKTGPSYERCQERNCWGKAIWTCPRCQAMSCSAHRADHSCLVPYFPRSS